MACDVSGRPRRLFRPQVLALWMPSFDPRDEIEGACEFYSWFGWVRHHHEPGLDGDWRFARVDVHAGEEEEDAWLLEAHAL
jgi:hypothetical protein